MSRRDRGRSDRRFLETWMADRARLVELLFAATVLALGINILASRVVADWPRSSIWIGVGCVVVPVLYLAARVATNWRRVERYGGVVVVRGRSRSAWRRK